MGPRVRRWEQKLLLKMGRRRFTLIFITLPTVIAIALAAYVVWSVP